jgi:hypothetical protein
LTLVLTSYGKLHLAGTLDDFGRVEDFKSGYAAIITKIGNDAGTHFVAFLYAHITQRDGERVGFLIVLVFIGSSVGGGDLNLQPFLPRFRYDFLQLGCGLIVDPFFSALGADGCANVANDNNAGADVGAKCCSPNLLGSATDRADFSRAHGFHFFRVR